MSSDTLALHGGTPVRSAPFTAWPIYDGGEQAALARVLESRNWGGYPSPNLEAQCFAAAFAKAHDSAHGVCAANGTVTLQLALRAAGVLRGDEVVVPPMTFMATAAAVVYVGAVPVFADVLRSNYCLDPDAVEAAITERTKAVICVHVGASVADLDRLTEICRKRGIALIEDCAHMHGAKWRDKGVGSWGDFGSFSFQSSKLMTAGEGGMILTQTSEHEKRLQSLINCGRREASYHDLDWHRLGFNLRMTEFQAAMLGAQLDRLQAQAEARVKGFDYLAARLDEIPGVSNLEVDPRVTQRNGYQFIYRFDAEAFAGKSKQQVLAALEAEGVPAYDGYMPLDQNHELFPMETFTGDWYSSGEKVPGGQPPCEVAMQAALESIWIPHQFFLGEQKDLDDIAEAMAKVQRNAGEL